MKLIAYYLIYILLQSKFLSNRLAKQLDRLGLKAVGGPQDGIEPFLASTLTGEKVDESSESKKFKV